MNSSTARKSLKSLIYYKQQLKEKYFNSNMIGMLGWKILRFVIIFGLCYIIIYPFFIKSINSFKSISDFSDPTVRFFPRNPTIDYIVQIFKAMNYPMAFLQTTMISISTTILQTIVCCIGGYGFARFKFKGRNILFFLVIMTLLVPPETLRTPLFITFSSLGMIDTPWPSVVLSTTGLGLRNGLYIFMFRQYFRNIPRELEEAAYIDGCGTFKTFYRIIAPSATAIIITVFLLSFSWQWTDTFYSGLFFQQLPIMANAVKNMSIPDNAIQDPIIRSTIVNTAAMLSIFPLIILYLFAQKHYVESVERSGIVG